MEWTSPNRTLSELLELVSDSVMLDYGPHLGSPRSFKFYETLKLFNGETVADDEEETRPTPRDMLI